MGASIGVSTLNEVISRHVTAETADIDGSGKQKLKENLE
jgi:hypothetical protein